MGFFKTLLNVKSCRVKQWAASYFLRLCAGPRVGAGAHKWGEGMECEHPRVHAHTHTHTHLRTRRAVIKTAKAMTK